MRDLGRESSAGMLCDGASKIRRVYCCLVREQTRHTWPFRTYSHATSAAITLSCFRLPPSDCNRSFFIGYGEQTLPAVAQHTTCRTTNGRNWCSFLCRFQQSTVFRGVPPGLSGGTRRNVPQHKKTSKTSVRLRRTRQGVHASEGFHRSVFRYEKGLGGARGWESSSGVRRADPWRDSGKDTQLLGNEA